MSHPTTVAQRLCKPTLPTDARLAMPWLPPHPCRPVPAPPPGNDPARLRAIGRFH